jgi:predicted ribosomally synthesized peptide with SipW-like signal peptide
MRKILFSLLTISAVSAVVIGATGAYFSDTETSTGNTFMTGTIDLGPITSLIAEFEDIKPSHSLEPVTIVFKNVGNNEGTLEFEWSYEENDKIVDGYCDPELDHYFEYWAGPGMDDACLDSSQSAWEMSADEFARLIYVQSSTQDGYDNLGLLTAWADANSDGKVSLYELHAKGQAKWYLMNGDNSITSDDTLDSGQSTTLVITFHMGDAFDGDLDNWPDYYGDYTIVGDIEWNVPQADGISADITAVLKQVVEE